MPKASKPVSEMTPAERAKYAAQLRRALRDDEVRRGRRAPKTMCEMEIWHEALAEEDERAAACTARVDRSKQQPGLADDQGAPAAGPCSVRDDATPEDVGQWMATRLQENGRLYQRRTAREIAERFGGAFTYLNGNGNLAIDKRVLKAFREAVGVPPTWSA